MNKLQVNTTMWTHVTNIMLSKRSQTPKSKCSVNSCARHSDQATAIGGVGRDSCFLRGVSDYRGQERDFCGAGYLRAFIL